LYGVEINHTQEVSGKNLVEYHFKTSIQPKNSTTKRGAALQDLPALLCSQASAAPYSCLSPRPARERFEVFFVCSNFKISLPIPKVCRIMRWQRLSKPSH